MDMIVRLSRREIDNAITSYIRNMLVFKDHSVGEIKLWEGDTIEAEVKMVPKMDSD